MYRFKRFTDKANVALNRALDSAREMGHTYVDTEHLLLGLLQEGSGVAAVVLGARGVTAAGYRQRIVAAQGEGTPTTLTTADFTPRATAVMEAAQTEAALAGQRVAGTEHLLGAILRDDTGVAVRLLTRMDARPAELLGDLSRAQLQVTNFSLQPLQFLQKAPAVFQLLRRGGQLSVFIFCQPLRGNFCPMKILFLWQSFGVLFPDERKLLRCHTMAILETPVLLPQQSVRFLTGGGIKPMANLDELRFRILRVISCLIRRGALRDPFFLLRRCLIQLQLQLRNFCRCFRHAAATASVGDQRAALCPQSRDRLLVISHIRAVFHQITQFCLNGGCGQRTVVAHLGQINTALERIRIHTKQRFTQFFRESGDFFACSQFDQGKGIPFGRQSEGTLNAVALPVPFENQIAAVPAAIPRRVFLAQALIQCLGLTGKSVKHRADKLCQCGLSEAIGFIDCCQPRFKIKRIVAESAKVFNIQIYQFHGSTSSPLSARMPQVMMRVFSSSVQFDAITERTNSPFNEMS